jgi:hypothetical protein
MKKINYFLFATILMLSTNAFTQEIKSKQDEKTQLFGFVDSEEKYIVNPIYKEVDYNFGYSEEGLFKVIDTKDKIGFVNASGKLIVPCKYDYVSSFENGFSVVRYLKGEYEYTYGFIDSTGKEVIPVKYGHLEYYPEDKVLVYGDETVSDLGLMNLKGEILIPAQYVYWSKNISKGLWPVGKNDKFGAINLKNQVIIPFDFAMIESYSDALGIAAAQKEESGKFGFIDRKGITVIPFEYDFGWPSDKYIIVKKNSKWGIIDSNNKIILPFEYAEILSTFDNSAWVIKNEGEEMFELDLITMKKK